MATAPGEFQSPEDTEPDTAPGSKSRSNRREARLPRAIRYFGIAVLFGFVALVLLLFLPQRQRHLSITHDFGVGFDLSPSYATVAVSYPNGSVQAISRVNGDKAYREMMYRLSLPSSRHLHQSYHNVGEEIQDIPRMTLRNARKKLGLPASKDVGTLSNMIDLLRQQASFAVGEPISAATVSIPHLAALYGEDLTDAFEYLSLVYLEFYPFAGYFTPIRAGSAAYAGNGVGLCADYTRPAACEDEERRIQSFYALTVSYTHASLTTSQAHMSNAYYLEEMPTLEDLRLGYDARHRVEEGEETYWDSVRNMLRYPVVTSPVQRNITKALVYGDAADEPKFREALGQVLGEVVIGGEPEIFDRDPEFSAAKGVAELAKRANFRQRQNLNIAPEL